MQFPILLDRSRPESLTEQLAEQLRTAIRHRRIPPGARLPSSRRLSEQLAISRNTAVRAYDLLILEGYAEARVASGIYAAATPPEDLRPPPPAPMAADAAAMPLPRVLPQAPRLTAQAGGRVSFDFFPGRPDAALFPLKTWRRLLQDRLAHGGAQGLTQYGDPGGLFALRAAIAEHLAASRGISADPGQVVITAGIQEGIGIAARLFLGPGTTAIVEDPCYQGAAFAFQASGAALASVPVDAEGLVTDALPDRPAGLVYVTPSHQYPTGHALSAARRGALIAWARAHGCYILEDDYDGDFRYEGSPLPSLAGLAPDCAIHLGTFSKSLGAGLRLGYMVVPPRLVEAARAAKALANNGNPWAEQATLAEFIKGGSHAAHLARLRTQYRERRDTLLAALRRHFGETDVGGTEAGLHLFWQLPPGVPDAATLEGLARRARVGLYPLAAGGAFEARPGVFSRRAIVLGYAALTPRQIDQGIARLSDIIDDTLDHRHDFLDALMVDAAPSRMAAPATGRNARPAPRNLQKPALRRPVSVRAKSKAPPSFEDAPIMPVIQGLYRYPIKGLSAQAVETVTLEADRPFPFDRLFALARPGVPVDEDDPKWAKKGLFVMLMLDEALAQVRSHLDVGSEVLTLSDGEGELLRADIGTAAGRAAVERFFAGLVPTLRGTPRLVRSRGGHFMDKPENVISLINLATLRSLEAQWGVPLDPLRFRANVYIDGAKPWQEFDWIGSDILLGETLCRVERRNGRCGATNVNPASGRRDLDIPGSLRAAFGHKDLGIYLTVRKSGRVSRDDTVAIPDIAPAPATTVTATPRPSGTRRHICRGCYFIYDEAQGLPGQAIPPGTAFAALPADWRCPDCGTDKTTFRPLVG
ncbi:aminotransferase class I/II-fold pyridoxal phosphate-dependent enzyme [Zavarzinia compransoris]|uniref:MocR-like pyridoxine biosynthesis transcription factor PdxR n=1 Tax=Zavarzinia marina TaxID=2911065 RepID=UPI001F1CE8EC|nr:aminotransferase class I/II-fold pyridoxal phosphate-dependent enzyme [Zavarzinia marina]MCF4167698.1 aminotransferase class I/II-fold pyridoxal phosphate-dependent enzyme [Zavarzinia marina]